MKIVLPEAQVACTYTALLKIQDEITTENELVTKPKTKIYNLSLHLQPIVRSGPTNQFESQEK